MDREVGEKRRGVLVLTPWLIENQNKRTLCDTNTVILLTIVIIIDIIDIKQFLPISKINK